MKFSAVYLGLMSTLALSTGAVAAPSDAAFNQLTKRVDGVDTRLGAAETEIKSVSGVAQSAQSGVTQLRADLQTVHQGVADAVQHAGSNSAAITANKQAIQKAQDGVNSNAQAVNGLSSDFNTLRTKVDTKADQAAVDSLRSDLTDVDNRKAEKTDFDQLSQTVTDVKTVADKAATDNARQDGQIRNIQTIVQTENNARKAEIAANTKSITDNKAATDKVIADNKAATDKQIGDLQTHVDDGLVKLNTKVNDVKAVADKNAQAVTGLGQRVTKLESDTTTLRTDVDANKQGVATLNTKMTGVQTAVVALNKDLGLAHQQIAINEQAAAAADAKAAAAQTGVDANKQAITGLGTKVDANKQAIDQTGHKVDEVIRLTSKLTLESASQDSRISHVEGDMAKMNTRVGVIDAKVDGAKQVAVAAQAGVDANKQDIATNKAGVDANKQAITATQVKVTANEQNIAKVQQQAALNASDLGKETAARKAADADLQKGVDANKQGVTEAKTAAATADAKAVMAQDSATKVGQRLDTTDQTVSAMRGDVDTNTANINALHQWQQQANANLVGAVNDNSAGIARNSQRLDKVEKDVGKLKQDVADVKDQTKRVGALGMAAANLHYAGLDSGYALAVGQYSDKTAIAGGLQFNINEKTAATVQVAYDTKDFGGSVGIHGKW